MEFVGIGERSLFNSIQLKIFKLIEIMFLDGILQRRLFGQDKLRWLMKVLIMNRLPRDPHCRPSQADMMPQLEHFSFLTRIFYAPFCDFYFFRDVATPSLSTLDTFYAISFDLFGAMILMGEFIAIYRRFVVKTVTFKTSAGDIVAVNLLGGWFILRFFCAGNQYSHLLPSKFSSPILVRFLRLSKVIAPLGLPWSSMNYPLWSIAGFFLGTLVGFIPYNKKLWHIITIPVIMFINLMPHEAFKPGKRKASLPFQ